MLKINFIPWFSISNFFRTKRNYFDLNSNIITINQTFPKSGNYDLLDKFVYSLLETDQERKDFRERKEQYKIEYANFVLQKKIKRSNEISIRNST